MTNTLLEETILREAFQLISDRVMQGNFELEDFKNVINFQPQLLNYQPHVSTSTKQYYPLIVVAAINDDLELVKTLVESFKQQNMIKTIYSMTDMQGNTALHYAGLNGSFQILKTLLEPLDLSEHISRSEVINATNEDFSSQFKVGSLQVPIRSTGGKTALHFSAENGECGCISLLLQYGADKNLKDFDGNTPSDLAWMNGHADAAFLLKPDFEDQSTFEEHKRVKLVKDWRHQKQRESRLIQQERITRKSRDQEPSSENELPLQKYTLLYPILRELPDQLFDQEFVNTFKNPQEMDREKALSLFRKEGEQLYSFKFFSQEFCELLIKESENIEHLAKSSAVSPTTSLTSSVLQLSSSTSSTSSLNISLQRPNSMNNYGLVLTQLEPLKQMLDLLLERWIRRISFLLYPQEPIISSLAEQESLLDSHYSFLVRYQMDEDRALDKHRDDSELTLNVCLGKQFSGGDLQFYPLTDQNRDRDRDPESDQTVRVEHEVGRGLIHLGRHYHQAMKIQSGCRINLIMWCRSSPVRGPICPHRSYSTSLTTSNSLPSQTSCPESCPPSCPASAD